MSEGREILKIQFNLYHEKYSQIEKLLGSLEVCHGVPGVKIWLEFGDNSSEPLFDQSIIEDWYNRFEKIGWHFSYKFVGENLGFGKGHNRMFFSALPETLAEYKVKYLLISNPDGVVPFHLLSRLVRFANSHPDWGIIEPRQLPYEHPKDYDGQTLETPFAAGSCAMYRADTYEKCGGYDEIFFIYAEDVDISWRIRAQGYKVYFLVDTFFFHSKIVTANGLIPTRTEEVHQTVSKMLLQKKYHREDLVEKTWQTSKDSTSPAIFEKISTEWELRKNLPTSVTDTELDIAFFDDFGATSPRRW